MNAWATDTMLFAWVLCVALFFVEPAAAQTRLPYDRLTPDSDATVIGRKPPVQMALGAQAPPFVPGQVVFTIDGMDATQEVHLEERLVTWQPRSELKPGRHSISVILADAFGQPVGEVDWSFNVRDTQALEEATLEVAVSASPEGTVEAQQPTDPSFGTQGNLRMLGRIREKQYETGLQGNLHLLDQQGQGTGGYSDAAMQLADFLMTARVDKNQAQGGDVTVTETELTTGPSFSRRGVTFDTDMAGTQVRLFATRAEQIIGFVNGFGVGDPDHRVQGLSIGRDVIANKALTLRGVFLGGTNESPFSYNTASFEGGMSGDAFAVQATSSVLDGHLTTEAEAAFSHADDDTADKLEQQDDRAVRLNLSGTIRRVGLFGQYQKVGPNFLSLANPGLVRNREGVSTGVTGAVGPATLALNLGVSRDNVDRDPSALRMTARLASANASINFMSAGSVNIAYTHSDQESSDEPPGVPTITTMTDTFDTTLHYEATLWSAFVTSSYSVLDTEMGAASGTKGLSTTLGSMVRPYWFFSLAPTFGFSRTTDRVTGVNLDGRLVTLSTRITLWKDWLTLDLQGSRQAIQSDDGLTDRTTAVGIGRLSLSLTRLVHGFLNPVISATVRHNKTTDDVDPLNNMAETGFFMSLDLFAPVNVPSSH